MKFLFDFFPVILFFGVYKLVDIYAATAAIIIATLLQIAYVKIRHGKVENAMIASGVLITIFGGATLLFHDESFIKWKPTILYWLFAVGLFISARFFNKNLIRSLMEKQISLPEPVWKNLNSMWAIFFVVLGGLNWFIAAHFSTDQWVNFKVFGTMILMFVFMVGIFFYISKYVKDEE